LKGQANNMKITLKKIQKEFHNLQTHFRKVEYKIIKEKYSLTLNDEEICKNVSGREFYLICNSLRKFYLRHQPEIIKDFENVISKYK